VDSDTDSAADSVRIYEQILIFRVKQWFFSAVLPPPKIQHKTSALDIKNPLSDESIKSR
jgi:hypothetical protein